MGNKRMAIAPPVLDTPPATMRVFPGGGLARLPAGGCADGLNNLIPALAD